MDELGALAIARSVAAGEILAADVARDALARIDAIDPIINSFTTVTSDRALAEARDIDGRRGRGETLPPLAGVPYAVKNLYDIAGTVTLAGSIIQRDSPPATEDAALVRHMREAGAVLVGATNMDEYAWGFTTENSHYGPTRNPHDTDRIAGGSSGGAAAAVAAGLVPLSLGSDTNGSIRVPASLSGLFALKPTFGRLSRRGAFPFCASVDHVGPFGRSVADLAMCYDALQGHDPRDPVSVPRPAEPCADIAAEAGEDLRIGVLTGYFEANAGPEALDARDKSLAAFKNLRPVSLPEVERARAAASVVTAQEGAMPHLKNLRIRPQDFDPAILDRFLAGVLIPAVWVHQAQRFRRWFLRQALEVFDDVDVLICPATPWPATRIGQVENELAGQQHVVARSLGFLTQPFSLIGLPAAVAPVHRPGNLPIGVQLIAAPWREDLILRAAVVLERTGIARAPVAPDCSAPTGR